MEQACENCRFGKILWRKGDHYSAFSMESMMAYDGERKSTQVSCRRYAPRGPLVIPENCQEYDAFPALPGDEWCGEYESAQVDERPKGQDPKGLGAKPASAVGEADAPESPSS